MKLVDVKIMGGEEEVGRRRRHKRCSCQVPRRQGSPEATEFNGKLTLVVELNTYV